MHLEPTGAWWLLSVCAALVVAFLLTAHSTKLKKNVPLFYCWLGAIAVLGGAAAFFLPIAVNSGFNKDDDGSALRQALLYTTGGLLGVITLGETHRKNNQEKEKNENDHIRQVHAERRSRYAAAVEQLANDKAPIRLGGVYTLSSLVDEWLSDETLTEEAQKNEGQVIINNLCSYIRSPFPLAEKLEEYKARKEFEKLEAKGPISFSMKEAQRYQVLLKRFENSAEYQEPEDLALGQTIFNEEQDVRRTIFVEMSKRSSTFLREKNYIGKLTITAPGSWSIFDFDFTQAPIFYPLNSITIEKANFRAASFYVDANFIDTVFIQDADFSQATFTNRGAFGRTTFAQKANFRHAKFMHNATFMLTTFTQNAKFNGTTFAQNAYFEVVHFLKDADFGNAHVTTQNEKFSLPTTFAQNVRFRFVSFKGKADFRGVIFAKNSEFSGIHFSDDPIFVSKYVAKKVRAQFSAQSDPQDYVFSVPQSSKPITLGQTTFLGKPFTIPVGAVLFDPDSWDEEKQEYTHVSEPAKPLENSATEEEKPAE